MSHQNLNPQTEAEGSASAASFRTESRRVARRWPTVVTVWAIVFVLAVLVGLFSPKSYSSEATLRVDPYNTNLLATPSANQHVDIDTEQEVAQSTEVNQRAAQQANDKLGQSGKYDADSVAQHVEVGTSGTSAVLTFTAKASSGEDSAALANAAAQAYLDDRKQLIEDSQKHLADGIDSQIKTLEGDGVGHDSQQITDLEKQRTQAQIAQTDVGQIISKANVPSSPSSNGLPYFVLAGLLGGLFLGVIVAFLRDLADKKVSYADRAGQIWGAEATTLNSRDLDESCRLLWRRINLGKRTSAKDVAVISTLDQESLAEEVSEVLRANAPATEDGRVPNVRRFSTSVVDSRMADQLDECGSLLVVSDSGTRRKDLVRLRGELDEKVGRHSSPVFVRK